MFGLQYEKAYTDNWLQTISDIRFISMYIVRKLTEMTTSEIGREFGDRDHSTVLNAMSNVEKLMKAVKIESNKRIHLIDENRRLGQEQSAVQLKADKQQRINTVQHR